MQKGITTKDIKIVGVDASKLKPAVYNPRRWTEKTIANITKGIQKYGLVDPLIVNSAPKRHNIVIGGHLRLKVAKDLGLALVPVVYVNLPDVKDEQELNLRLNRNTGEWDWQKLADFDEALLLDIGFEKFEIDNTLEPESEVKPRDEDELSALKITIEFKTLEEKEQFVGIIDHFASKGIKIDDKIHEFIKVLNEKIGKGSI